MEGVLDAPYMPACQGRQFSVVRILGRRQNSIPTMTTETNVNRCRTRGEGWRERREMARVLNTPGSHPLSWGGERKRRTRKQKKDQTKEERRDREFGSWKPEGGWFITEAGANSIKYGKFGMADRSINYNLLRRSWRS